MSFVEDSEGHVKVAWVSKFNVSVEPIVYMLQSRWNVGIHPSEDHASPWTTVAMVITLTSLFSPFILHPYLIFWRLEILKTYSDCLLFFFFCGEILYHPVNAALSMLLGGISCGTVLLMSGG